METAVDFIVWQNGEGRHGVSPKLRLSSQDLGNEWQQLVFS